MRAINIKFFSNSNISVTELYNQTLLILQLVCSFIDIFKKVWLNNSKIGWTVGFSFGA